MARSPTRNVNLNIAPDPATSNCYWSRADRTALLVHARDAQVAQRLVECYFTKIRKAYDAKKLTRRRLMVSMVQQIINQHEGLSAYPQAIKRDASHIVFEHKFVNRIKSGQSPVFRGTDRQTNEVIALKEMMVDATSMKAFNQEIIIWSQLHHENVLSFLGVFYDESTSLSYFILSPMMPKTLAQYVTSTNISEPITPGGYQAETDRKRLMVEIARGIAYLHSQKVVHGDIKDTNIFIDQDNHAKLADFGLTILEARTDGPVSTTKNNGYGTYGWKAPEQFGDEDAGKQRPVDVFAYACICYMLITGQPPFKKYTERTYRCEVVDGPQRRRSKPTPDHALGNVAVPKALWRMITGSWRKTPHKRLIMSQVLMCLDSYERKYMPMAGVLFAIKAKSSYVGPADEDDSLDAMADGETVEVIDCSTNRWFVRRLNGVCGYVPISELQNPIIMEAVALEAFSLRPGFEDRRGKMSCLEFKEGQKLHIVAFGAYDWVAIDSEKNAGVVNPRLLKPQWPEPLGDNVEAKALRTYKPESPPHHVPFSEYEVDDESHTTLNILWRRKDSRYAIVKLNGQIGLVDSLYIIQV